MSVAQFGMWLLLASLLVLFAASVVAYLVTRNSLHHWSGKDLGLPYGLIASTVVLGGCSLGFEAARKGIKRNSLVHLKRGLLWGSACGAVFLITQAFNWFEIVRLNPTLADRDLSLFTFYMLTGLHAVHVIGGFFPVAWVWYRANQREYSSSRYEGVSLCVQYWHFLGLVWLGLVGVMCLA